METAGVVLVLSMCLVGAVIAYAADLLGRQLGKKRLSLFGLRPKHTAALLTTVAGGLIPIVTIAVLSASVKDVRVMLQEGSRAASERDKKVLELQAAQKDLGVTRDQIAGLTKTRAELEGSVTTLRAQNTNLENQRNKAIGSLRQTQSSLSQSRRIADVLKRSSAVLKGQVGTYRREVSGLQNTKQRLETDLKSVNDRLKSTNAELNLIQSKEYALQAQLSDLDRRIKGLLSDKTRLESASDEFLRQIEDLQRQKQRVEESIAEVGRQRAQLMEDIDSLNSLRSQLIESLGAVRTQPMTYARGEELFRIVVPAGASESIVRSAMTSLLRSARIDAKARGAAASDNYAEVSLIPIETKDGRVLTIDQQENMIVEQARQKGDPQVLIANSLVNSFAGEFVRIGISVLPNTVVYKQGQVIAETRIDGLQDERQILAELNNFVRNKVAQQAIKDQMIPAAGKESGLGEVDSDEVVRLVNELKSYGRPLRVQALAAKVTRRADRLQISFRLR